MRSGNLVSGLGFAFIINGGHSLIGGGDYLLNCVGWASKSSICPSALDKMRPW